MGVPKFFRFISERYPCLSEVVKEYQIPEFDNLYLDMNGIIHTCSHPDDGNAHFRITEEKIFTDVFHYLEVLFRMIKPQRLFFMAVDGVAPRAKMNQQRGRRFRSAKDADKLEKEAKKRGEKLPEEARFDSNCITPGTEFMARLHEQLKYFVVMKVSTDKMWRKCKIVLSGHETPGEGEHKIMDYIRYLRSKPGYDPNTRHCLYGLDADLIMLGLCTHEPHFSLLREEVKFGKKANSKRRSVPEDITFFLLHLSLLREYLELEFTPVKNKLQSFDFDIEKIIDDWVLMGFLVGNDFIPHFPNLHINDGALPTLYQAYMEILPTLDGYINEAGKLNLVRFQKLLQKLGRMEEENFEDVKDDLLYMEAKTGRKYNPHSKVSTKSKNAGGDDDTHSEKKMDPGLALLIQGTNDMYLDSDEDMSVEDESSIDDGFINYKKEYYKNKMEFSQVTPEVMRDQAEGYVRAIQWNLHYYYDGVCSWSWYYPHHYAPYISDVKDFTDLKFHFDLGKPFHPYEQLLAVLPPASMKLLPEAYHDLMTSDNSSIKDYYPEDFQTDLNGKKQDWEAVVLVPFIDEKKLLEAMKECNNKLTEEERKRNSHGPMLMYSYTAEDLGSYAAPSYYPEVDHNHANCVPLTIEDIRVPREKLIKGAYPDVKFDVYYPGFPTMKYLSYTGQLKKAKVKVFEQPSRNENMILKIKSQSNVAIPFDIIGKIVYVGWPHLVEARVHAINDGEKLYRTTGRNNDYTEEVVKGNSKDIYRHQVQAVTEQNMCRWGIDYGSVEVLVQAQVMIGRKYEITPNGRVTLAKQFHKTTCNFPVQGVVKDIVVYGKENESYKDIDTVFPNGSTCFILANPYYGCMGTVVSNSDGRIKIDLAIVPEPDFSSIKASQEKLRNKYRSLYNVASSLSMTNHLFSRLTGTILIEDPNSQSDRGVNIGLDLKFNKKNLETPGYTKKIDGTWHYTDEVVKLLWEYGKHFPEVIDYLSVNPSADELKAEKVFGENCDVKVKELRDWIKALPTHNIERRVCGSDVLDLEVVKNIEDLMDNFYMELQPQKLVVQIKPQFVFNLDLQTGNLMPDPSAEMKVMDRIVNVREGYTVPLGLKGTIIGIHRSKNDNEADVIYDVVFDKPFLGGLPLNCSDKRGYRIPRTAFINISHGMRLFNNKIGKPTIDTSQHRYLQNQQRSNGRSFERSNSYQQQNYNQQHNSAFATFCSNYSKVPTLYNELMKLNRPQPDQSTGNSPPRQEPLPQTSKSAYSSPKSNQQQIRDKSNCFMPVFEKKSTTSSSDKARSKNVPAEKPMASQPPLRYIIDTQVSKGNTESQMKKEFNRSKSQECNENVSSKKYIAEQVAKRASQPLTEDASSTKLLDSLQQQSVNELREIRQKHQNMVFTGNKDEAEMRTEDKQVEVKSPRDGSHKTNKPTHESPAKSAKSSPRRQQPDTDNQAPVIVENRQKPENSAQVAKINTEYLKSLLKINNSSNERTNSRSIPATPKVSTAQAKPNMSYSIQLLNYFQANGYGLPRFQYINIGDTKIAQITLPNNKLIVGPTGANEDEASENASKAALEELNLIKPKIEEPVNPNPTASNFPVPPQQWVEHPPPSPKKRYNPREVWNKSMPNNQFQRSPSKQQRQPEQSSKKSAINLNIANSFVPLQVIKKVKTTPPHYNRTLIVEKPPTTTDQHKERPQATATQEVHKKNSEDSKVILERRQRPQRKMRLAANFSIKPQ